MFCRYCGKEITHNAMFCRNCGKKISDEDIKKMEDMQKSVQEETVNKACDEEVAHVHRSESKDITSAGVDNQQKRRLKPWAIVLIAVGGVLMLLLTILLIAALGGGDSEFQEPIYYEPEQTNSVITDQQAVQVLFYETDYISADDDAKIDIMGQKLNDLENQGIISQITYDEELKQYNFRYSDGGRGVICLEEQDEYINGAGGSSVGNKVQNAPISVVDGETVNVLILKCL